jgi:RNA polymerase sigma factor (sigma-70 family)
LPLIDRIIAIQTRRHALSDADADDYAGWAKARLIEGEYAVFRKFGGRSSLQTYLTAVLTNLFRDFRNSCWGRWRPSAAAKRHGPVAIRLEELLYRQACSLREAVQILRSAGVQLSESELSRLAAELPARGSFREVSLEHSEGSAAAIVDAGAALGEDSPVKAIESAIGILIQELPAQDALILRMRFWSDMSVADIARALNLNQKSLYRRIESIQILLRHALETKGIDRVVIAEILSST